MQTAIRALAAGLIAVMLITSPVPARAELIEEIVAWVNGEIITKTDLEEEEQALLKVLREGPWWNGPKARAFEAAYAAFQGAQFGITCCNGTALESSTKLDTRIAAASSCFRIFSTYLSPQLQGKNMKPMFREKDRGLTPIRMSERLLNAVSVNSLTLRAVRSRPRITSRYCAAMSFVFKARRRAHSRAYVTVAATPKTDGRASRIGKLFLDGSLVCAFFIDLINALLIPFFLANL